MPSSDWILDLWDGLVPFDSRSLGLRPTDHSLRTTIRLLSVARHERTYGESNAIIRIDWELWDWLVPFDSRSLGLRPTDHSLRTTIRLFSVARHERTFSGLP